MAGMLEERVRLLQQRGDREMWKAGEQTFCRIGGMPMDRGEVMREKELSHSQFSLSQVARTKADNMKSKVEVKEVVYYFILLKSNKLDCKFI